MKMRQSLAQLEQEFLYEAQQGQRQQEQLKRTAEIRARQRWHARERKRSSVRFYLLTLSLIATAVIVTVVMFVTLYLLLS